MVDNDLMLSGYIMRIKLGREIKVKYKYKNLSLKSTKYKKHVYRLNFSYSNRFIVQLPIKIEYNTLEQLVL